MHGWAASHEIDAITELAVNRKIICNFLKKVILGMCSSSSMNGMCEEK
jgi:hypothetical protein